MVRAEIFSYTLSMSSMSQTDEISYSGSFYHWLKA